MPDPDAPTAPPHWIIREFHLTTPFLLRGELEYQSWDDLERTLTGEFELGQLPQFHFEFSQEVSRLQGGLGLQLFKYELPQIGPFIIEAGMGAMARWGEEQGFELSPSVELRHVRFPRFSFGLEGAMTLSGSNDGGQPQLGGEIMGALKINFDLTAPRGTYSRR
jgi:hypothetical protein